MEIYIVRHGETLWNKEGRLQGNTDIALSEKGINDAKLKALELADIKFDKIFSSPLDRAYKTAELLRGGRDIDIIKDERLRELSFGIYEGKTVDEIRQDKNSSFNNFFDKPHLYKPDKTGESLKDLIKRSSEFLIDEIEKEYKDLERVLIVAHGATNRALISYMKNLEIERFFEGGVQKNLSVIKVVYDGKYLVY